MSGSGNITVWINSPGGDCVAAAQIYNMLMDYHGDVTVKIDGIAASAASVIAMAGTKVLMSPTALMMIHNPLTVAIGDSEEMQKAMEDGKSTYDMFASAMEGLVTINVVYEDLGALYGKLLDEAGYLEIAVPKLEDALTSMGLSNVKVEQTPVQFAGLVREGAVISGEMDDVPMYETLVCIKQEGYMCCVTMCSWTEDITADLVELFYQA